MAERHVITVTGPRAADSLGVVDAHDHLLMDSPGMPGQGFTDPGKAIAEVLEGRATGIGTIVEMTPIGLGPAIPPACGPWPRRPACRSSRASGYHRDAHYPDGPLGPRGDASRRSPAGSSPTSPTGMHPADWVDPALPPRPGARGCHQGRRLLPPHHARRAAAPRGDRRRPPPPPAPPSSSTARSAPRPTRSSTCSRPPGARPDRIALAHLDRNPDAELHAEIAARGVTLEYDTIGRTKYHPDWVVLDLIEAVAAAGHLDRIMLGLDLGLARLLPGVRGRAGPALPHDGLRAAAAASPRARTAVDRILVANPARFYRAARATGGAA